jgi:spore coat polysaccharide biosynthesis protein SpsF (cytidylyltransferase family)
MSSRLRRWLRALQRNPSLEEKTMRVRRQQLLDDLYRAVAGAPDDVPIKSIVERLNRHRDD